MEIISKKWLMNLTWLVYWFVILEWLFYKKGNDISIFQINNLKLFVFIIVLASVCVMVNTCCMPGCKSEYKSVKANFANQKIQFVKFSTDVQLWQKWMRLIPCDNWNLSAHHRVCSKHFIEDDYITTWNNRWTKQRLACVTENLQRFCLEPNVVPHVLPSFPMYFSKSNPTSRSTASTFTSARCPKRCC